MNANPKRPWVEGCAYPTVKDPMMVVRSDSIMEDHSTTSQVRVSDTPENQLETIRDNIDTRLPVYLYIR